MLIYASLLDKKLIVQSGISISYEYLVSIMAGLAIFHKASLNIQSEGGLLAFYCLFQL